ncbi:hypothetical protein EBU71_19945 [bacterium]|jgi:hypothetical protein|nr:hypothetical protein [Candidatus Elulimicrobium humile]
MSMVNPAAVPMPGAMSNRSDLPPSQGAKRLPNPAYGEQQQFLADQKAAPMAKAENPLANIIPLGAETRRANEFVTAGVGGNTPGPGREILGIQNPADTQIADLTMIAKYLPLMQTFADSPNSTGTMKAFTKYLKSQIDENIQEV